MTASRERWITFAIFQKIRLDFRIFQYYLYKKKLKLLSRQKSTGVDNLPPGGIEILW